MEDNQNPPPSSIGQLRWRKIGRAFLIAIVYFLIARLSLLCVVQPEGIAIIWPPSGFVLAVLLLSPRSSWLLTSVFIFISNAMANMLGGQFAVPSIGFAFVNTLEPLIAAALVTRFSGDRISFECVRDVVGLAFVAAGATTAVTALLGAAVVTLTVGGSPFWSAWQIWWVSDGVGMLIATPLFVTVWNYRIERQRTSFNRILEAFFVLIALVALTLLSFHSFTGFADVFMGKYLVFPVLAWAALRFGPRGAALATFVFVTLSVFATIQGFGPFSQIEHSVKENILALQLFLGIFSMTGGLLAANTAERQEVSKDLLKSEQRYRGLFEQSNDAILIHDHTGRMLDLNQRAVELLGYSREELIAMPILTHYPDDVVGEATSAYHELQRSGHVRFDSKFRTKDGSIIDVELSERIIESHSPVYQAHIRNITDRVQKETQLRLSEERFRTIWDNSFDGMRLTDEHGTIVLVNPAFCRQVAKSRDELEGRPLDLIYAPPDGTRILRATLERFKDGSIIHHYEHQATLWDGRTIWFELSNSIVELGTGSKFLLSIFRDVSDRKRAERALELSEEGLKKAQKVAHVGSWTWNIATNHLDWSDEMFRIFGLERAGFSGRLTDVIAQAIHPEDRAKVERSNLSVVDRGRPVPLEYRIIWPDQTVRVVWAEAGELLLDAEGKPQLLSGIVQDITERKRNEEKTAQLAAIVESSDDVIISKTLEGLVTTWNRGAEQLYGYTEAEMLGKSISLLVPPECADDLHVILKEIQNRRHVHHYETTRRKKDGTTFDVSLTVSPILDAEGNVIGASTIGRDITDRKMVERELARNEELLKESQIIAGLGSYFLDIATGNWKSSEVLDGVFGIDREYDRSVSGWVALIHPDDQMMMSEYFTNEVLGKGHRFDKEYRIVRIHDKAERWVHGLGRIEFDSTGHPVAMFGTIQDITESKLAERALRESEQRYRQFFDEDLTGDFVSTVDGKLLSCNPAFARIYGFHSVEEALQSDMHDLYPNRAAREEFLQQLRVKKKLEYFEEDARRQDGKALHLVSNIIGVFDPSGELVQMRGYVFDDTERKKLEDQLRYTQKLESIGTLAGGIAHDFNNLLNAVLGQSALALDKLPKESPAGNNVTKAIKAAERAADLTRQLLAYSGKGKFISETIDLNLLIKENLQMLEVSIPKTAQLRLELGVPPPLIRGDVGQIQQVIMNLIINAGDAIGSNRGYIGVCTSCIDIDQSHTEFERFTREALIPGRYVLLQVMDTGLGMSQTILNRIFDPFFTTKFSGRGLGLAAVLGIIRGHHGGMRIKSVETKGTTFEIVFPMLNDNSMTSLPQAQESAVTNGDGKTILVIDDESFVLELLTDILTGANFKVLTASNPVQGIELFRQHLDSIELVILDYSMPEMDGKATFMELLKIDSRACVLLCSGYTEDEVEAVFGDVRPRGFLHKPYKPDMLLGHLRRVISERSRTA